MKQETEPKQVNKRKGRGLTGCGWEQRGGRGGGRDLRGK